MSIFKYYKALTLNTQYYTARRNTLKLNQYRFVPIKIINIFYYPRQSCWAIFHCLRNSWVIFMYLLNKCFKLRAKRRTYWFSNGMCVLLFCFLCKFTRFWVEGLLESEILKLVSQRKLNEISAFEKSIFQHFFTLLMIRKPDEKEWIFTENWFSSKCTFIS